jgi:hypothetical protein
LRHFSVLMRCPTLVRNAHQSGRSADRSNFGFTPPRQSRQHHDADRRPIADGIASSRHHHGERQQSPRRGRQRADDAPASGASPQRRRAAGTREAAGRPYSAPGLQGYRAPRPYAYARTRPHSPVAKWRVSRCFKRKMPASFALTAHLRNLRDWVDQATSRNMTRAKVEKRIHTLRREDGVVLKIGQMQGRHQRRTALNAPSLRKII